MPFPVAIAGAGYLASIGGTIAVAASSLEVAKQVKKVAVVSTVLTATGICLAFFLSVVESQAAAAVVAMPYSIAQLSFLLPSNFIPILAAWVVTKLALYSFKFCVMLVRAWLHIN